MRTLYQFPISHYCEKTRWNLDAKALEYTTKNLLPGPHRGKTQQMANVNTVPILVDGPNTIGDSTEIALYLEKTYPDRPLLPKDEPAKNRALELESAFDQAGIHVRAWMYGILIDSPELPKIVFRDYPIPLRVVGKLMVGQLRDGLRRLYKLRPENVEKARGETMKYLDTLDQLVSASESGYLVGDRITIADITAASLLAPLLSIPSTPWEPPGETPAELAAFQAELQKRPAGQWIQERYQKDRHRAVS